MYTELCIITKCKDLQFLNTVKKYVKLLNLSIGDDDDDDDNVLLNCFKAQL